MGLAGHLDKSVLEPAYKLRVEGEKKFTRRHAIDLADFFGVPPMSLVWRLEQLSLIKKGSWAWFKDNGGITKHHIEQVRQERNQ